MFIAFEGLDGSGSSTHSRLLAERLRSMGKTVFLTKEPTNEALTGKLIREALQGKWETSAEGLQLLFTADRAHHLYSEIEPALKRGEVVITDRYVLSTLAYGGMDVDMDWLKELNRLFRWPDITFLLKLDASRCIERIQHRIDKKGHGDFELFEREEKLRNVWTNYERIAQEHRNLYVIDSDRPKEVVTEEIWAIASGHLGTSAV